LIEAIRTQGMGMAKRKGKKIRSERNFARGEEKLEGKSGMEQKCTCTRGYADIGEERVDGRGKN